MTMPVDRSAAVKTAATSAYVPNNDNPGDNSSFVQLACLLLQNRRLIAGLSLVIGTAVVAFTLLAPKKYTTTVSFTPVSSDLPAGGLASLAGQFGVSLPTIDPSQTPDFYAQLLQTPDILLSLIQTRFAFPQGGDTLRGNLIELYEIDAGDEGKTLAEALRLLRSKILTISYDRQTSIVEIGVRTKWAPLSEQLAVRVLELVNEFNLASRQEKANDERRFLAERLDTSRVELRGAESRMQAFLLENRSFEGDPTLLFEHDRLQRDLTLRQEIFSTLTQALEQARIRAVRNTRSVSLVEHPAPALRADRRHTLPKLIFGLVIGGIVGLVWVVARETFLQGRNAAPAEFESLMQLWRATTGDIRRLLLAPRRRA